MIISAFLLLGFLAQASEKPECKTDVIAPDCSFFRNHKEKPFIDFKDGTSFPNPFFVQGESEKKDSNYPPKTNPSFFNYSEIFADQAEALELLEGSGISARNKLAVINMLGYSLGDDTEYAVHWPLNDRKKASPELKSRSIVLAELKKIIGDEKFKQISDLVGKADQKSYLTQQSILAEKVLAAEKEQSEDNAAAGAKYKKTQRQEQVKKLFSEAQQSILSVLRKGRSDENLSPEEKILIEKVKSVQLADFDSDVTKNSPDCQGPNAFLNVVANQVHVCESVLFFPNRALIGLLGHEIAHSIDPCNCRMPDIKVDKEKLRKFEDYDKNNDNLDLMKTLSAHNSIHTDIGFHFHDEKLYQKLIEEGILTKISDGIDIEKYPLQSQYNCLTKELNFRNLSKDDIEQSKKFVIDKTANEKSESDAEKATKQRYLKALDKYSDCMGGVTHHTHMGEVIPDMFGALVQEKYIQDHPFEDEADKATSYWLIGNYCSTQSKSSHASFAPGPFSNAMKRTLHARHPFVEDRINKIFLNLPGMEESFECKRKQPACFDQLSIANKVKSKSNAQGATK